MSGAQMELAEVMPILLDPKNPPVVRAARGVGRGAVVIAPAGEREIRMTPATALAVAEDMNREARKFPVEMRLA